MFQTFPRVTGKKNNAASTVSAAGPPRFPPLACARLSTWTYCHGSTGGGGPGLEQVQSSLCSQSLILPGHLLTYLFYFLCVTTCAEGTPSGMLITIESIPNMPLCVYYKLQLTSSLFIALLYCTISLQFRCFVAH